MTFKDYLQNVPNTNNFKPPSSFSNPFSRKNMQSRSSGDESISVKLSIDNGSDVGVDEIYDPHLKVSKYQWGETKGANKMRDMTPGEKVNKKPVREQYLAGEIFKIGAIVEAKGKVGKISFRGSNYVTVALQEGNTVKCWLEDVREIEFAKTIVTFKNKIPVLLMTEQQKKDLGIVSNQLEFDGIQTNHFDMCQSAFNEFKSMIETLRDNRHIGELTGHHENEPPTTEKIVKHTTSDVIRKVNTGINMKPSRLKKMQFKQYLEL
jgi:hypothetical protein